MQLLIIQIDYQRLEHKFVIYMVQKNKVNNTNPHTQIK